jgi:hypothetical protein
MGAGDLGRAFEEFRHVFEEMAGMGEGGVKVESRFVAPAGMEEEEMRIPSAAKSMNAEAAGLGARRAQNGAKCFGDGVFAAGTRFETDEDEEFHAVLRRKRRRIREKTRGLEGKIQEKRRRESAEFVESVETKERRKY